MSTIQQAAKRLEELRRAGVAIPWDTETQEERAAMAAAAAEVARDMAEAQPGSEVAVELPANARRRPSTGRHSDAVELDLTAMAAAGFLVPGHGNAQLGEEFRAIKRPLIRNAQGRSAEPIHHANLIVVTSALAGEGKTFFSTNLAL